MYQTIARLIRLIAVRAATANLAIASWASRQMEESVSKEQDALKALDEAMDRLEAWQAADDETDAAAIQERVNRINALVPAPTGQSHLPTDTLTGQPVSPDTMVTDLGPKSPDTSAPETSAPEDEAPVQDSEDESSR